MRRIAVLLVLLVLGQGAYGVQLQGLYQSRQWLPDQSQEHLRLGQRRGLAEVVVKVTGQDASRYHPLVQQALETPQDYLTQYAFAATSEQGEELLLQYDPARLDELLRRGGLRIWGAERGLVLAWLALEEDGARRLLAAGEHAAVTSLQQQAKRRGLPLLVPMLDLQDQALVSDTDVWGLFMDNIDAASQRYGADALLVGRLEGRSGAPWRVRWSFWLGQQERHWSGYGADVGALMASASDRVTSLVAAKYAVSTREPLQELLLTVTGVATLADFEALRQTLNGLINVVDLQVWQVQGDRLSLRLSVQGGLESLWAGLQLQPALVAPGDTMPAATDGWRYTWQAQNNLTSVQDTQ